ncbi:hypothetical protein ZWY2020_036617 [Hordeum vulgare]|nr:hypothetical protein ZWY2020_036617 [Hordeum vulgare]
MREATGSGAVGASSTQAATGLALMAFLVGMPRYRIFTVQGSSVLLEIFRVYVAAIRNRNLQLPENPDELYEISRSKAAPEVEFVSHRDRPFRLRSYSFPSAGVCGVYMQMQRCLLNKCICSEFWIGRRSFEHRRRRRRARGGGAGDTVEHAKAVLAMVPIFAAPSSWALLARFNTFSIRPGSTMNTWVSFRMQRRRCPSYLGACSSWHAHLKHLFVLRMASRATSGIPTAVASASASCSPSFHVHRRRRGDVPQEGGLERHAWTIPMVRRCPLPPALNSMSTYIGLLVDLFFWLLAMLSFINFLNYLYWASWYKYVKPQDEDENVDEQQV